MPNHYWPSDLGIPQYACRQCDRSLFLKDYSLQVSLRGTDSVHHGPTCNDCRTKSAKKTGLYFESDTAWQAEGSCVGEDPELWFSDPKSVAAAKAATICQGCPVKALCATYAAEQGLEGIWGGRYYPSPVQRRPRPSYDILNGRAPRKGADNILVRGRCTKGLHAIGSMDDVYVRSNGSFRCRVCWDEAAPGRTQKMRERRERARVGQAARS